MAALLYATVGVTLAFSVVYYFRKLLHAHMCNRFSAYYNARMEARKRRLFGGLDELAKAAAASDRRRRLVILDLGCGPGTNFEFYPAGSDVICVDPNGYCEPLVYDNVGRCPDVRVSRFHVGGAENLRELVEADSVDAVVVTLVLCTVDDVVRSLQEIVRVLKPASI